MKKQKIIIITGSRGSGKSTLANEFITLLKMKGIKIGGVITKSDIAERYEKKLFYTVVDILSNQEKKLITSEKPVDNSIQIGRFYMNQDVLLWANKKIAAAAKSCNAVLIDELGPAELQGLGYAGIAKELINRYKGLIIFVVRIEIVEQMITYLQCESQKILLIDVENRENHQLNIDKVIMDE